MQTSTSRRISLILPKVCQSSTPFTSKSTQTKVKIHFTESLFRMRNNRDFYFRDPLSIEVKGVAWQISGFEREIESQKTQFQGLKYTVSEKGSQSTKFSGLKRNLGVKIQNFGRQKWRLGSKYTFSGFREYAGVNDSYSVTIMNGQDIYFHSQHNLIYNVSGFPGILR